MFMLDTDTCVYVMNERDEALTATFAEHAHEICFRPLATPSFGSVSNTLRASNATGANWTISCVTSTSDRSVRKPASITAKSGNPWSDAARRLGRMTC